MLLEENFLHKVGIVDTLLAKMNYEYVYTPDILDETLFVMRWRYEMEKKKVQILNFNCTFGDCGEPLLNRFTDYFYPAITIFKER